MKKIIIIGGGAAGLMAAVNATDSSYKEKCEITVIEKNNRPKQQKLPKTKILKIKQFVHQKI